MEQQKLLSIGQVLDRGFTVYRLSLRSVFPYTLISSLLALVVPRLVFPPSHLVNGNKLDMASFGGYFMLVSAMGLIALLFKIAVVRKQDDIASGRNQLTGIEPLSGALRYFLPVLGVSFLLGFIIMIGFLLLIVPGIFLSVSLCFAIFALVLDGDRIGDSLERSRVLVRGHWWRTATILTVAMLIYLAVYAGVTALATLALPLSNVMSVASGNPAPNTLGTLLVSVVVGLCNAALLPMIYAIALVTYRDLQLRKGGEDLAARIAATV